MGGPGDKAILNISMAHILPVEAAVDTGCVGGFADVFAVHGEDGHADKEVKGEL